MNRSIPRLVLLGLTLILGLALVAAVRADISAFDIKKPKGTIKLGQQVDIEWLHHELLTRSIKIELRGVKESKGRKYANKKDKTDIFPEACLANTGRCSWTVPEVIQPGEYRITITSTVNKQNYLKGPVFKIVGAGTQAAPEPQSADAELQDAEPEPRVCTGGRGSVLVPKADAKFSVGASVMLEWESSGDAGAVDLYLDCDQFLIDTGVPDKGFYLWKIPADAPVGNRKVSVLPGDSAEAGITSKKFSLQALPEEEKYRGDKYRGEKYRGRDQRYDSDLSDRPQVTSPVEGSRYPAGEPITLRWDDPDHFLLDRVRIELYRHHKAKAVARWRLGNSGIFELSGDDARKLRKFCRKKPGCYFVVYSARQAERWITSGHFVIPKKAAADPEPSLDVRILPDGTEPGSNADSLVGVTMGDPVEIRWQHSTAINQRVRIELLKDGLHYLALVDALESTAGEENRIEWRLPYTLLPAGGYRISVTGADDAAVFGTTPVFEVKERRKKKKKKKLQPKAVEDGAWQLKTARTIKRIHWEKPPRLDALRVDLYHAGRRLKTISDSEARLFIHWSVPRTLRSGPGYQIRIQELVDRAEDEPPRFAFSEPFCIYRHDEDRDAVCGSTPASTRFELSDAERGWCEDKELDEAKCRPALEEACTEAGISLDDCTPAALADHERCVAAGIDGACTPEALTALYKNCQRLGIGLVLTPDYDGNTQTTLASGAMTATGTAEILTEVLLKGLPEDAPDLTRGLKKTLLGKKARKVEIKLLAEPATEPDADKRYRFGIRYRIRNSEDQAIEEFSLTHDLNRVFKKGGFEFEDAQLVADPSCTQEAVQAKTPDEVPESEAPAEELAPLSAETTCSGGPFEKGSILLAITGERPDDAGTVQRYFSDHITGGDGLVIEQITSDKPWNPLRLERAFQVFEGRHRLSEAPRRASLVLLKIPVPSDESNQNKAVFGRYLDDPKADPANESQDPQTVVVDYEKRFARVAWPQGPVRWLARYAVEAAEEEGVVLALDRLEASDDDGRQYGLEGPLLRGSVIAATLVNGESLRHYTDDGEGQLLDDQGDEVATIDYESGQVELIEPLGIDTGLYVSYLREMRNQPVNLETLADGDEDSPAALTGALPAGRVIPGSLRLHLGDRVYGDAHYSAELRPIRSSGKRRGNPAGKIDYDAGTLRLSLKLDPADDAPVTVDYLMRFPAGDGRIDYASAGLSLSDVDEMQGPLECVDLVSTPPVTASAELEPVPSEAALAALLVNLFDSDVAPTVEDFEAAGINGVTPANLAEVLEAIRAAKPEPTSAEELQAIVDGVIARLAGVSLEVVTYLRNVYAPSRNPAEAQFSHDERDYFLSGVSGGKGDTIEYLVVVSNTNEVAAPSAVLRESPPAFAVYIEGSAERDATGAGSFTELTDQSEGDLGYAAVQVAEGTLTAYLGGDGTVAGASDDETPGRSMLRYRTRLLIDPLAEVFEDSAGGDADANGVQAGVAQLEAITGITGVIPANEVAYQEAIAVAENFDNPATVEQVQEVIDAVNTNAGLAEVLEDSNSPGGAANANGIPVSAAQLEAIAGITNVIPANEAAYQEAVFEAKDFANPPSLEQIQNLIDTVNANL